MAIKTEKFKYIIILTAIILSGISCFGSKGRYYKDGGNITSLEHIDVSWYSWENNQTIIKTDKGWFHVYRKVKPDKIGCKVKYSNDLHHLYIKKEKYWSDLYPIKSCKVSLTNHDTKKWNIN